MPFPTTVAPAHVSPLIPDWPKEVTVFKNQGYSARVLSGVIYTVSLAYNPMTVTNYAAFLAHFNSMQGVQGLAFAWTHPRSSAGYTVKYKKFEPVVISGLDPHTTGTLLGTALNIELETTA